MNDVGARSASCGAMAPGWSCRRWPPWSWRAAASSGCGALARTRRAGLCARIRAEPAADGAAAVARNQSCCHRGGLLRVPDDGFSAHSGKRCQRRCHGGGFRGADAARRRVRCPRERPSGPGGSCWRWLGHQD